MSYHDTAMREEHRYGEIISSTDFEESVFQEIEPHHFIESLAQYLLEKQSSILSQKRSRKDAYTIAKQIYRRKGRGTGLSDTEIIQLVKNAIEKGCIWKFKLEEVWHPAIFQDQERLTTVPWQHKYAVFYTRRPVYEFYSLHYLKNSEEGQKMVKRINERGNRPDISDIENLHNAESVLKTGFIKPGVRWAANPEEAEMKVEKTNQPDRSWAIYLGMSITKTEVGRTGELNPVLEVELPTKFIRTPVNQNPGLGFVGSLECYFEYFDSPKQFMDLVEGNMNSEFHYTKTAENHNYPVLPLNYVNGACLSSEEKYFIPLKEYTEILYEEIPTKLPPLSEIKLDLGAYQGTFQRETSIEKEEKNFLQMISNIKRDFSQGLLQLESGKEYVHILRTDTYPIGIEVNRKSRGRQQDFNNLMRALNEFKKRRQRVAAKLEEYSFSWENEEVNIIGFLLKKDYKEIEEFCERSEEDIERIIRIERSQAINTRQDQEKVEKRFSKDLSMIISMQVTMESIEKLIKGVSRSEEEYAKFAEIAKEKFNS